ncbi:DUF6191 domain-containing protein [Streptomyces sp. JH14]|uniref:DUF6191 domain-containing protein n=1 Tax=Streptomyces sp. JH14 TaxID=2793630 RepID=UPI0023F9E586|nr:DUF6191 domain-containing protein [Streptomyces sp. JH14]MDF6045014.1 DUF6191 domain-containing protein [Streptomyces sp. JH14]
MFNFFEELFAPGRKHAAEEQKRLELTRVDLGVGDPGRGPIDLASGKVTVRLPEDPAPDAEDGGEDADGDENADGPSGPTGG